MYLHDNALPPQEVTNLVNTIQSSSDGWQSLFIGNKEDNPSSLGDWDTGTPLQNVYFKNFWSETLHQCLEPYLSPIVKIKPTATITYTFYRWGIGGQVVMHDDANYSFSATLYLNTDWHVDWGGYLIWFTNNKQEQVVKPKYNRLVIFDNEESHLVTPITQLAQTERLTVQIRGIKLDDSMGE